VVENNLARKKSRIESTGIGLSTIREKYRLLQGDNIQVDEHNNEKFTVTLPLIRP
jgi:signal transduction histidine kinase